MVRSRELKKQGVSWGWGILLGLGENGFIEDIKGKQDWKIHV